MELRHLRYFVAVAEELNYRKASERLHVAQPALSSQIQDLEAEVGVKLLNRNTGGVRLTDAGAAFLDETRLTLAQAQLAVTVAREAEKGRRGKLTVGFFAPLLMGFMPASLTAFHEKFPDVDVNLVEMSLGEQLAALEARSIHVGFAIAGRAPFPPGFQHAKVVRSEMCAVVGRGHRLAGSARLSLDEIKSERWLSLSVNKSTTVHGEIIREVFKARGLKPAAIKSIDSAEVFRAMLESGLGISLIAGIGSLSRSPDLLFKPLKETGSDLFIELHALWREESTSLLTANFIDVMVKIAPREKLRKKQG